MKKVCPALEESNERAVTPRILVVDDNVDLADTMSMLLQELGCYVETAYHAKTAILMSSKVQFDYFILDIGLPDISGYELLEALRQDGRNDRATFFAYSAYGDHVYRQKSLAVGFKCHFVKPDDFEKIVEHITNSLGI